ARRPPLLDRAVGGRAAPERLRAAVEQAGIEDSGDAGRGDRTAGEAPASGGDVHERLEPVGAPRAVAYQLYWRSAARRLGGECLRDLARAHRQRASVAGHVDGGGHGAAAPSATSASKRSGVTRP